MVLFFLGSDDILQGLGGKGLDDLLGRDIDGGAGLGIPSHARLAGPDLNVDLPPPIKDGPTLAV